MAYFDNAATTFPKPAAVYDYMDQFYRESGANAGRGHYGLALNAGRLIAETRELIQEVLHCPAKQVVFEPTATIALNIILQGLVATGIKNIYISPFEHNAVTRTLHHFEKNGVISVQQLTVSKDMQFDLERSASPRRRSGRRWAGRRRTWYKWSQRSPGSASGRSHPGAAYP